MNYFQFFKKSLSLFSLLKKRNPLKQFILYFFLAFVLLPSNSYADFYTIDYDEYDAEERISNGNMYLDSSDLEMPYDGDEQIVGMRFNNVNIPQGATITKANIRFRSDHTRSDSITLRIYGDLSNDAAAITGNDYDLSSRTKTNAYKLWTPGAWSNNQYYTTVDFSNVIQEIVNLPGFAGDDIVIMIARESGSGYRRADSRDQSSSDAPRLEIEYTTGTPPTFNGPIPNQSATQGQSFSFNVANYFIETDGDSISYSTTSTLPNGMGLNSNGILSGTPTESGTFSITVTATDKDGSTDSNSFTLTVAAGQVPPIVSAIPDQSASKDENYTLDLSTYVTQTNGDAITGYTLSGALPNGLSFNSSTGVLSGTPTQTGTFNLTLTATDDDGTSNDESFDLVVTDPSLTCDNSLDTSANDASPGATIPGLHGATSNITRCISGESASDDTDYYNFTIGTEGNLTITTSSPNGHDNHFQVWINGNEVYAYDTGQDRTLKYPLRQNDTVVVLFKETGSDTDEYEAIFDFVAGSIGDVLIGGDRPFTVRNPESTRNISGNYTIIGNANQCALHSTDTNPPWTGSCYQSYSNNRPSRYIDVDNDGSTVNSTTSTLNIPNFITHGAKVVWAGLYWQGVVHNSNKNGDFMGTPGQADGITISGEPKYSTDTQIDFATSSSTYGAEKVKFKVPGGSYVEVKADQFDFYKLGYAGFKDVTSMMNQTNPSGTYAVADIKSNQGVEDHHGNYASWALVVIYEDPHEKFRNITLFDGYVTVDSSYNEDLVMSGFLTPRVGPIHSKLAMFAMDGDNGSNTFKIINEAGEVTDVQNQDNPNNSLFDSTISNSIDRDPDATSLRTDLKVLELIDVLNPLETTATLRPRTGGDRYTPSFFIMSAELIKPDLCYDYAYQQNGRYFTEENDGSKDPHISGSLFSDSPITVSLFVKNRENSDFTITNLTTTINPIDTTQASYIDNSVKVILPGETVRHPVTPLGGSGTSYINDVPIGTLGGKEFYYLYYDLDPDAFTIDMPLNAYLDYNATFELPNGTTVNLPPYHQKINSDIPLCVDGNFSYAPIYGTFNVEQKDLNYYNIYTQVTRRVDDFEVKAYDANNTETPINVSTMVAIELIDAGAFHETQTTCQEPDSSLTPRIWVTFDGNVSQTDFSRAVIEDAISRGLISDQIHHESSQIDEAEDFYDVACRNTAFRISTNGVGSGGELIHLEPGTCQGQQVAPCYEVTNFPDLNHLDVGNGAGNCATDVDGNPGNTDRIPQFCGNAGNRGLDKSELAVCMECLYGYNMAYFCSRDNFAIRPEAFKVSLTDDNTTTLNQDFANNTNKSGSTGSPINLVAGYPYRFDLTATSHTDENPVKGYVQGFDSTDERKRAYMEWNPQIITESEATTYCNAPKDRNMSFYFVDGNNSNTPINTWEDYHDTLINVGEYEFKIIDEEWTKYDWEANLTQHHNAAHFTTVQDCITGDNSVPGIGNRVGCETSSIHGTTYKAVNIRSHPYRFYVEGLTEGARPNNDSSGSTFVYINTLDLNSDVNSTFYTSITDENMSYNIQGAFRAASYDNNKSLSNFVNNCYAEDVDMLLRYGFINTPTPSNGLTYDLFDYNVTGFVRVDNALPTDNIIQQAKTNFSKVMEGSIDMDLGYNYDRTYNTPINPIYISMNDFNISYTAQPSSLHVEGINNHKIFGNVDIDQNVTFIYARTKPSKFFYDDITTSSVVTPVSVVVYCDLGLTSCQNRGLPVLMNGLLSDAQSNEANWWFAQKHDSSTGDGEVTLTATSGTVVPVDPTSITLTNGIDNTVTVTNNGTTPNIVDIDFGPNTDRWLIYNRDNNSIPSPFYRVRFIGSGGWTGHGKTGHVVGDDINKKKLRRVDW